MKSLILTSLYLFKDTVYRWKERPSSALSRLLVVFFLSLCALAFLANYVLSTKLLQDKLRANGADLVVLIDYGGGGSSNKTDLIKYELTKVVDADVLILNDMRLRGAINDQDFAIVEYGDEGLSGLKDFPLEQFPYLALLPADSDIPVGPATINVNGYSFNLVTRKVPSGHMLEKLYQYGIVLVPTGVLDAFDVKGEVKRYVVKVKEMTYENIKFIDQLLKNIARLDGSTCSVQSSERVLADLDVMLNNQTETRAGFSIGIAVIVGILLTALASMEFRENEYVYTLMKSFGVRPFLLVFTFIMENVFLVGLSFCAAVAFFMEVQKIILREFFKLGNTVLTLQELRDDILLLVISLGICVLVSSIPIAASAYREIGRVLK